MYIEYINDESHPVTIRVNHQLQPSLYNPHGEAKNEVFILKPQESKLFYIDAPEGSIPYVKRWENRVVLLTYSHLPSHSNMIVGGD